MQQLPRGIGAHGALVAKEPDDELLGGVALRGRRATRGREQPLRDRILVIEPGLPRRHPERDRAPARHELAPGQPGGVTLELMERGRVEPPDPHEHARGDPQMKVGRVESGAIGAEAHAARLGLSHRHRLELPQRAQLRRHQRLEARRRGRKALQLSFGRGDVAHGDKP